MKRVLGGFWEVVRSPSFQHVALALIVMVFTPDNPCW